MFVRAPELLVSLRIVVIFSVFLVGGSTNQAQDSTSRAIDELIQGYHLKGEFDGAVLIARKDEVIFRKGYGLANREKGIPNLPGTVYRVCSITKQLTALLVMQQVENGNLRLDGTVAEYLPDFRQDTGSRITLRHLLTHTSGLPPLDEALPEGKDGVPGIYADADPRLADAKYVVKTFCGGDLKAEPGKTFSYNNADYLVLAAILEKVSAKPYAQLLQERILDPLEMRQTGLFRDDPNMPDHAIGYVKGDGGLVVEPPVRISHFGAAGGMYSTVDDLLRWDRALDDDKLLGKKSREIMFTPRSELGYVALGSWVYNASLEGISLKPRLIERQGNIFAFNTLNIRAPDEGYSIILYSNIETANLGQIYARKGMVYDLMRVLYGERDAVRPK